MGRSGWQPFDRTCRRGVRLRLTRSPQVESLRTSGQEADSEQDMEQGASGRTIGEYPSSQDLSVLSYYGEHKIGCLYLTSVYQEMSGIGCHSEEPSDEESFGSSVRRRFFASLRMTLRDSWLGTACCDPSWVEDGNYFMLLSVS